MPSRSEGWGGLFKDEQYRLIRSASIEPNSRLAAKLTGHGSEPARVI